eukprot:TRINITY_DN8502_c0_g1_i3.p1 TRINITY_DN8502_c0_g1~~TRINITY_DN8502_c0_g1_i3.p1  ORF type:complete len:1517 (+),score=322.36 TRINITY_DN8502_c0_g1_i3:69-4553(+)
MVRYAEIEDEVEAPLTSAGTSATEHELGSKARKMQLGLFAGLLVAAIICLIAFSGHSPLKATTHDVGSEVGLSMDSITPGTAPVTFNNIELIASGYNVYYSDPAPPPDDTNGLTMDPAMRKPVFAVEFTRGTLSGDHRHKIPDGFSATVDLGCSKSFTVKSVTNEYDYTAESSRESSLTAGAEASVGYAFPDEGDPAASSAADSSAGAADSSAGGPDLTPSASVSLQASASGSATLSSTNIQNRNEKTFDSQRMLRSMAKCSNYVVGLEFGAMPKTAPDFQKAVDGLAGEQKTDSKWWDLFDTYGTHYMTTVRMGARYSVSMYFDNSQYATMEDSVQGLGVSVEGSASAVAGASVSVGPKEAGVEVGLEASGNATLLSPAETSAASSMEEYIVKKDISVMGAALTDAGLDQWKKDTAKKPVPIQSDRKDICLHQAIVAKGLKVKCLEAKGSYCDGRLSEKGAPCTELQARECNYDLDCEKDSVCREYKCFAVPVCYVTVCDTYLGAGCGDSYTFPATTAIAFPEGQEFSLENGNWRNKVSAIKLSDGCEKVYVYDDDDKIKNQDDETFTKDTSLEDYGDLDDDIKAIRAWAKKPPSGRRLDVNMTARDERLRQLNDFLARRKERMTRRKNAEPQISEDTRTSSGRRLSGRLEGYFMVANMACGYGDGCSNDKLPITWGGGEHTSWSPVGTSASECAKKCKEHEECSGFNYDRANNRCYYRSINEGGTTCNMAQNKERDCYDRLQSLMPWPKASEAELFVTGGSFLNRDYGSERSIVTEGNYEHRVSFVPGSDPRTANGDNYAGLRTSMSCDGDDELRFGGFAAMQKWVDESKTNGITLEVSSGESAMRMTIDGVSSLQRKFDVKVSDSFVQLLVNDNGDNNQDDFFIDASFYCQSYECPTGADTSAQYIKNVGKAMYGYNHYFGAPMSTASAGTDPGFKHRSLWEASYNNGKLACWTTFTYIPKGPQGASRTAKAEKSYEKVDGMYLGKPLLDKEKFDKDDAHQRCDKLGASCDGYTCNYYDDRVKCILRAGKELLTSSVGRWSYVKKFNYIYERRLQEEQRKPLLAGPRRLEESPKLLVPDGWTVKIGASTYCEQSFDTQEVKSQFDYEAEQTDSFGIGLNTPVVSFGYSKESYEFRSSNGKQRQVQFSTKAECIDYIIEIEDLANNPPPVKASFQDVVDQATQEQDFHLIFDMYGLEFPTKLLFGARYGYTRFMSEQGYSTVKENTKSTSVSAGVSLDVGEMVCAGACEAGVSAEYGLDTSEGTAVAQTVKENSLEVREVTVGKPIGKGGIDAWVKEVGQEPMPIRFQLTSICEHPAFGKSEQTKEKCEMFAETYCPNHLSKTAEEGASCETAAARTQECLFNLDCGDYHVCNKDGLCIPEPPCWVTVYDEEYLQGEKKKYGPIYFRERPDGERFDLEADGWRKRVMSAEFSGGCAEVTYVDQDSCMEQQKKNKPVSNQQSNSGQVTNQFPKEIRKDMCMIYAQAKEEWLDE